MDIAVFAEFGHRHSEIMPKMLGSFAEWVGSTDGLAIGILFLG